MKLTVVPSNPWVVITLEGDGTGRQGDLVLFDDVTIQ